MSFRYLRASFFGCLVLLAGLSVTGCNSGSTVTKTEEDKFKNPPKEMPEEAKRYMRDHGGPSPNAKAPTQGAPK